MVAESHPPPNDSAEWAIFDRAGEARALLDQVTGRWGMLVIMGLSSGRKRFGELHTLVEGCSEKMLAKALRELERSGLVTRTPYPTIPPRVDYELTLLGHEAALPAIALATWVQASSAAVARHQREHDIRQRKPTKYD
ncbi:helix-turn-helix domain-containing protein [Agreia sp. PsM10]|uniref:winged helix-turn-helix transcriptional regulator n=1 Tax=Agreia sp. PsM10 TaxID=3030533 RepID=UPI00263BA618|nr:helix-turn-helix domain-containing protein [Agreia sp. PsM10]MDN4640415.1 helix-turn-helix domain-containing protein [Agreia sp. PsM10]